MSTPIVLASSSPRRKQLLEMLRIPFRVIVPDVDENVLPGEAPDAYVTRLSKAKAQAVVFQVPGPGAPQLLGVEAERRSPVLLDDGHRHDQPLSGGPVVLVVLDAHTRKPQPTPSFPPGVISTLAWHPRTGELAVVFAGARTFNDVYSLRPGADSAERWTVSEAGGAS